MHVFRCSVDRQVIQPAMLDDQVPEPHPSAVLVALQLFLEHGCELCRLQTGFDQQLFPQEARSMLAIDVHAIQELLEQDRDHNLGRHEILGHERTAERDAASMDGAPCGAGRARAGG
jgi:hypothetical protein